MTGPKGNSEFCFPKILIVSSGETKENIEVEWKQNSLFPEWQVIRCFVLPPKND